MWCVCLVASLPLKWTLLCFGIPSGRRASLGVTSRWSGFLQLSPEGSVWYSELYLTLHFCGGPVEQWPLCLDCVHLWGPLTASGSREYNSLQITSKTEDALQVSATLNWYFQANFQRVWIVSAFTARIYKMHLREVRIFEVCGIFIVCVKASCRGRLLNVLDSFPDVGELCNSFYLHRCLYCSSHRSLFKFCCLHSSQCHNSSSPTNSSSACHSISLFCGEAR